MSLRLEAAKHLDQVLHRLRSDKSEMMPDLCARSGLPADEGFINLENADQLGNF